jgi:hypothetical protein
MNLMRTVAAAAVLMPLTLQVAAQDLPVLGQGNLSCGSWKERRAGDAIDAATMTARVLGYMTAYNQYGASPKVDVSEGQPTEEFAKWIDEYCDKNPTASLYSACASLIAKFQKTTNP